MNETLPLAGPGTGIWTGPVTGLGGTQTPWKGPGTRDWGTLPPPWTDRQTPVKTLPSRRTTYTGCKNRSGVSRKIPVPQIVTTDFCFKNSLNELLVKMDQKLFDCPSVHSS